MLLLKRRFGTELRLKCPIDNNVVWFMNDIEISSNDRMGLFKFRRQTLILNRLHFDDQGKKVQINLIKIR